MTVFLLQQRLVESRPERFNAFHTAPVDPPSNRENNNISRCLWQTHLSILGTAPPALRFCNTMQGMLNPSPCSTLKLSICSGPAAMGPRRSTCRPRNKCWNVHWHAGQHKCNAHNSTRALDTRPQRGERRGMRSVRAAGDARARGGDMGGSGRLWAQTRSPSRSPC